MTDVDSYGTAVKQDALDSYDIRFSGLGQAFRLRGSKGPSVIGDAGDGGVLRLRGLQSTQAASLRMMGLLLQLNLDTLQHW